MTQPKFPWALLVIIALLVLFVAGLKIVNEYQRIVVFRLGRCIGARGPGVQYIFPVLERGVWKFKDVRYISQYSGRYEDPGWTAAREPAGPK